MKKHIHKIVINSTQATNVLDSYTYDFGNTKNVRVSVAKGYICIEAELQKIYDKQEMLSQNVYLFPDAIKKALLAHIVLFSEHIKIKTISVHIDEDSECVVNTDKGHTPPLYSMVIGKLNRPFSVKWGHTPISGIFTQTKSSYDSRTAALFAFICSKCKHYESERFIYLWMAFNGMYNYFALLISDTHSGEKIRQECKKLRYFQRLFSLGDETISDDAEKKRIAQEVTTLIRNESTAITLQFLKSKNGQSFCEKIQSLLVKNQDGKPYNLIPYGYLLTQFSYYYRCNLIHANKPLALFSFADESEICCLRAINSLLEEFIENNLNLWFDSKYVDEYLRPAASSMEIIKK